jgi:hypothetical protein
MIAVERAKLTESNIEWLDGCGKKWVEGDIFSHFKGGSVIVFNRFFQFSCSQSLPGLLSTVISVIILESGDEFCNAIADELKIKRPYEDKMTELEQLKKRVEQLEKLQGIQPTEKPMERWKPSFKDNFCFIDSNGKIVETNMQCVNDYTGNIKSGNAFPEEMLPYLESDTVKLLQFHLEMAGILWQIDRENMGQVGVWGLEECRGIKNLKQRRAFQYSFTEKETANLAWSMLSDEIKEWLTT